MYLEIYYKGKEQKFEAIGGKVVYEKTTTYYYYDNELIGVIFRTEDFYSRGCDVLETAITIIEKFLKKGFKNERV